MLGAYAPSPRSRRTASVLPSPRASVHSPAHERDTVWDALLPLGVNALPEDLAKVDTLLAEPALLAPFRALWAARDAEQGRCAERFGRPTLAMASYVRLMFIKSRTGWGYETLVREVSDSLHLRRFCLIPLTDPLPSESTVRKLTRRLGSELVAELIRELLAITARERRFHPAAVRVDSTVIEADIRYPTDIGLAATGVRLIAAAGARLAKASDGAIGTVRDRSRSVERRVRAAGRTLRRRTGEARDEVMRLTAEAGALLEQSVAEVRRVLARVPDALASPSAAARRAIARLADVTEGAATIVEQIGKRIRNEKIGQRLVSFADPDARPVRKGKLATPTQFGYTSQYAEVTPSTKHGVRGLLLPPVTRAGSVNENPLLTVTVAELGRLGWKPTEASFDAGFTVRATREALADLGTEVFIVGCASNAGSRRTRRRLACYRVGCEGRISHLKRRYHAGRSRLRGEEGARTWENWAVFAYDCDTAAALPPRRRR